jgi:EAL domain-containing protein (putative c-di-GMP-specific phosphodiesterase class I)
VLATGVDCGQRLELARAAGCDLHQGTVSAAERACTGGTAAPDAPRVAS